MLYGNETKLDRKDRQNNIYELRSKFVVMGGFGVCTLDNLMGLHIKKNDIDAQIKQEESLIVLYEEVFSRTISNEFLEQKYLGRKKLSIGQRVQRHLCKYRLPKQYLHTDKNKDVFYLFIMNNTMNGYMNRLYWNEREHDKL